MKERNHNDERGPRGGQARATLRRCRRRVARRQERHPLRNPGRGARSSSHTRVLGGVDLRRNRALVAVRC